MAKRNKRTRKAKVKPPSLGEGNAERIEPQGEIRRRRRRLGSMIDRPRQ